MVEHYLDTVGVRGSNPLSRTIAYYLQSLTQATCHGSRGLFEGLILNCYRFVKFFPPET